MTTLPATELIVCCSQPGFVVAVVMAFVVVELEALLVAVEGGAVPTVVDGDPVARVVELESGATTAARGLSLTRDPAAPTARYATIVVTAVAPSHPRMISDLRTLP
jgi:hypothetical protein